MDTNKNKLLRDLQNLERKYSKVNEITQRIFDTILRILEDLSEDELRKAKYEINQVLDTNKENLLRSIKEDTANDSLEYLAILGITGIVAIQVRAKAQGINLKEEKNLFVTPSYSKLKRFITSRISPDLIKDPVKAMYLKKYLDTFYQTTSAIKREHQREKLETVYKDKIQGYLFSAHLDNRTTVFCREHHNKFYKASSRAELRKLYGIDVPAHYNCRSLLIPVFKDTKVQDLI